MRFGPFHLDSASRELRRDGLRLKITGQPLQILRLLIERPGEAVTREELCQRLWTDGTFVDFDHSLNTAIKRLRRALDDDPDAPKYIETIPKCGYRFIGELEQEPQLAGSASPVIHPVSPVQSTPPDLPLQGAPALSHSRHRRLGWRGFAAILLFASLTVGTGVYLFRQPRQEVTSIAVLPFVPTNGDSSLQYLSDGIADNVIDDLSHLHGFGVTAWSLSSRFRSSDAVAAGGRLHVKAILTGTLRKEGDTIFVRGELLDPLTGRHLWGEEYTRHLAAVSSIQREISTDIARHYRIEVPAAEQQRLANRQSGNPEAYELYLKGRYSATRGTKEGLAMALDYFKQATDKDPGYALAYSGLAYYYFVAMDWLLPPKEADEKARAAAQKAISLDSTLAEAHTMLGVVHWIYDHDWASSSQEFEQAIALNPSYAPAHQFYALYLASLGRDAAALQESRRALAIDPLSVELNASYGQVLARTHHTGESILQQQKTVALDPNDWFSHFGLGLSYLQAGQLPDALSELHTARRLEENADVLGSLGLAYGLAGDTGRAREILGTLQQRSTISYVPPYDFAQIYIGLGDKDRAFAWLEKARQDRGFALVWLRVTNDVDPLRADPRFATLLRTVGFRSQEDPPHS